MFFIHNLCLCVLQYFYEKHKFINKIRIIWICNEIYPETHKHKLINKLSITWIHYAGSRTDFWGKNRAIFSGELFSGEEFLPRTAFSGKKCRSILSNQVISWNRSRADRCPLGREFSAKKCSLLGAFFFRFKSKLSFRGKEKNPKVGDLWIHSTANYWEQSCRQVMLLPKFLSRKKLSSKYRSILASKISPATGVRSITKYMNNQINKYEYL